MKENFIKQIGKWLMVLSYLLFSVHSVCAEPAFEESFELGIGLWSADNGLWEVGTPEAGPDSCHSGSQCAGTVLNGNYSVNADSHFISPSIRLPDVSGDDEIHLRFWQWFSYYCYGAHDGAEVQISVYDEAEKTWSDWSTIGNKIICISQVWSQKVVDLTAYSSQKIRIAFYHTAADSWPVADEGLGWYIDDIQINGVEYGIITCSIDSDGDGIPDSWDQCADTLANSCVNRYGCICANGSYTQQQMDQVVQKILTWGDTNGDGKIGLTEAINALQITSGIKNP